MRKAARTFLVFLLSFLLANSSPWLPAFAGDIYWDATKQFFDNSGNVLTGGKIETFDAQTTTQRTTYQDSGEVTPNTNPIILGSDGRPPQSVFIKTGSWKYTLKDKNDALIRTVDNLPGALDTTAFSTEFAKPQEPVVTLTSSATLQLADRGKVFNADATGGAFTITLLSAILAGDGHEITIRRTSATGTVSVTTTGGQTINGSGSTIQLVAQNEVFRLVSDGANWHTLTSTGVSPGSITTAELDGSVTGRLQPVGVIEAWPGTKAGGNTCPAGYLEADGSAQNRTTFADLYNLYSNNGASPGMYGDGDGSTTFNLPDYRGRFLRHMDGTAGLDPDKATRTDRGDGTTGNNVGTKQAEDFILHLHADGTLAWSQSTGTISGSTAGPTGNPSQGHTHTVNAVPGGSGSTASGPGSFNVTSGTITSAAQNQNHTHSYSGSVSGSATVTGTISGDTANTGGAIGAETRPDNIYVLYCVFASVSQAAGVSTALNTILTGPGVPTAGLGNDGDLFLDTTDFDLYLKNAGAWAFQADLIGISAGAGYNFDAATADADPGSGDVALNNAALASVTQIFVSDTDRFGADISAEIATWADSDSTVKGTIRVTEHENPANFAIYTINGAIVDATTYQKIPVTHVDSGGSFTAADHVEVIFSRTGDKGDQGITGATGTDPGIRWDFDVSTTMGEPGDGDLRLNNAALASVTAIAVDDNSGEVGNPDASAWVLAWDDIANSGARGTLVIAKASAPENFAIYNVTGASTDNTTWVQVAVTHVASAGSFTDTDALSVHFTPAGADGSVTGPGSSTDTAIARWNGTGGTTLQDSGVTIDGSDNLNTTGELRESGTAISPIGEHTVNLLTVGMVKRVTNGASFFSIEEPTNDVMVSGYEFSASVAQAVQIAYPTPKGWDSATAMPVKFYWTPSATAGTGNVIWAVRARCARNDDAIDGTWGTAATVTDGFLADGDQHISAEVSVTVGGTCAAEAMLYVELFRDAAAGGDTYTQTAVLQAAMMSMTTDAANDN